MPTSMLSVAAGRNSSLRATALPLFLRWSGFSRSSLPAFALAALVSSAVVVSAQSEQGSIEGRVTNAVTGASLNNARVGIKGTNIVEFTDEAGTYRFFNVPSGSVTLRIFYTGLEEKEVTVTVSAGAVAQQDVALGKPGQDDVLKLSEFVVQSQRETDAAAIAVNEQRMALGQKAVISADQFGVIPDNNPGELMKWLPGVSVEYFANNIVGVSVRGLDAANTEINFDGLPVASASTATASTAGRDRNFEMMGASAADISRVEIRMLRTPEDPANALGGSLNLIRRSAFEAATRKFTYNVLFTSDAEDFSLGKRPSIRDTKMHGWRPNLRFTYTDPVSKKFGYAITLSRSDVLARVHWSSPSWSYGNAQHANQAEARRAAGQALTTQSVYNPLLTQDLLHDNPKQDIIDSLSAKFDFRPVRGMKASYTVSASRHQERTGDELRFFWNTGAQTNTNPDSVLGTPGTNGIGADGMYANYGNVGTGSIRYDMREAWRNGDKQVFTNAFDSEYRSGGWTLSARGSISMSRHTFRDVEDGFFQSTTFPGSTLPNVGIGTGSANPRPIRVNLLQRDYKMSHDIRAYDNTGAEVNWQDLNNMFIGGAVSRPAKTKEIITALRLSAKHSFRTSNPFNVRLGYDYDERFRNVQRWDANIWTFVGPDGTISTQDDNAAQIQAVNVMPERDSYYDSPAVPRISLRRLYDIYRANPGWFRYRAGESHRFSTVEPYEITEETMGGYVEFSGGFFRNRLTYVGGVRYERTENEGVGSRDNGNASVAAIPAIPGDDARDLLRAQTRYVRKGASGKGSNDGYFPSMEANYNLTENWILRFGYAKTQAKNRFARSVIPSSAFDATPVTTGTFAGIAIGTVDRPNPNLKPWTANNWEAHLDFYTPKGGVLSVGAFRKDIQNVQVRNTELLDTPEKLAELDLENTFLMFQSTTWRNEGGGRIDGAEFSARQSLDVILPDWAHGFTFTGSFNYNDLKKFNYAGGNIGTDFQNFYQTQIKASLMYRRGRFGAHVGVIENGKVYRQRDDASLAAVVGTGTTANPQFPARTMIGHRYYPPYTTVDFSVDYRIAKWAKLFISGRNITDAQKIRVRRVDGAPEWSHFHIANNLGVTYTVGVTGEF